ncbi:hypothetical protein, partial [Serratia marcescens]|uniref:hypothetical protein n=1 Tax=Serratia marcescens TaxID=615 RepID=UPI002FD9A8EC
VKKSLRQFTLMATATVTLLLGDSLRGKSESCLSEFHALRRPRRDAFHPAFSPRTPSAFGRRSHRPRNKKYRSGGNDTHHITQWSTNDDTFLG